MFNIHRVPCAVQGLAALCFMTFCSMEACSVASSNPWHMQPATCRDEMANKNGWDTVRASMGLKLQERPVGRDGRVVPEVSAADSGRGTAIPALCCYRSRAHFCLPSCLSHPHVFIAHVNAYLYTGCGCA